MKRLAQEASHPWLANIQLVTSNKQIYAIVTSDGIHAKFGPCDSLKGIFGAVRHSMEKDLIDKGVLLHLEEQEAVL